MPRGSRQLSWSCPVRCRVVSHGPAGRRNIDARFALIFFLPLSASIGCRLPAPAHPGDQYRPMSISHGRLFRMSLGEGKKNSKNNKREREKVYIVESHTRTETRVAHVFPGARISGPRLVYTIHCIYTAGHKYYITIRMTFFSDNLLINGTQIFMHLCKI